MIDTIKIYAEISKEIYKQVYDMSIIKSSHNNKTKEILYEIVNDHLKRLI